MPASEPARPIATEWATKADNDLRAATFLLTLKRRCPVDAVCFHAQQCVEKYLKALLISCGIEFQKTHDIEILMSLLPDAISFSVSPREREMLTDFATTTRYPGNFEISIKDAQVALKIAQRVRRQARTLLRRR